MFDAELVARTDNGPVEQRPYRLDGVCVNITANPFFSGVVDGFMNRVGIADASIARMGVGVDGGRIVGHGFTDKLVQDVSRRHAGGRGSHLDRTATLNRSKNRCLVVGQIAGPLAADVGLVDFNGSRQGGTVLFHGGSDSVAEIPCCLGGHAECSFDLVGRDALFGFGHQIRCEEPFPERQFGVMEDGSGLTENW